MKITFYFLLIATTLSHQHIPFIRHFDFISFSSVSFLSDQISLKFNALNSTFHLLLERNDFLIHSDTTLVIHNVLTSKESTHTIVAYPYKGIVKDANPLMKNWARILFHKDPSTTPLKKLDFDGHFAFNGQMYHISTIDFYRRSMRHGLDVSIIPKDQRDDIHRNARMILYKDTDSDNHKESHSSSQHKAEYGCGYIPSDVNEAAMDHFAKLKNQSRRLSKRAVTPATCFQSSKKVVSMAAAADCTYTTNFGGSENTLNRILSDWNSASQVYEQTFNIQLALSQVKILQGCGDFNGESLPWNVACSDAFTVNKRLSAFSQWRGSKSADTIGLWHLLTKCKY